MSNGEERIISILNKKKIPFEREKTFIDLRKRKLRFDFYIGNLNGAPAIIEFDGEGHFLFVKKFYHSKSEFERAKERDRVKNEYCLANGIKLYRIPYWDLDKINILEDIQKPQYLVTTKWHNDYLNPPALKAKT